MVNIAVAPATVLGICQQPEAENTAGITHADFADRRECLRAGDRLWQIKGQARSFEVSTWLCALSNDHNFARWPELV